MNEKPRNEYDLMPRYSWKHHRRMYAVYDGDGELLYEYESFEAAENAVIELQEYAARNGG